MLADRAFGDDSADQLGFKPFADAISGVIDSPQTATPLVMAISAKWGAGKTTLAQMVRRRLQEKPAAGSFSPHVTCWFDAWMHDEAPTLSTSLAVEIAQVADSHRSRLRRVFSPLPSSLASAESKRIRKALNYLLFFVAMLIILTVVSLRFGTSLPDLLKLNPQVIKLVTNLPGGAYWPLIVIVSALLFKFAGAVLPVAKTLGEFVKDPSTTAGTASMSEVRKQLGKLIHQATPKGSKFVIFVDDLDRCRPPRSVEVLEVVNQLLDHRDVVVMLMADMRVVAKAAEIKYREILDAEQSSPSGRTVPAKSTFGWDYLQKVVQLQFDLPAYSVASIQQMMETLAKKVPEDDRQSRLTGMLNFFSAGSRNLSKRVLRWAGSFWGIALLAGLVAWGLYRIRPKELVFIHISRLHLLYFAAISGLLGGFFGTFARRILSLLRNSVWTFVKRREIDRHIKVRISTGERDFSKVEAAVRYVSLSGGKDDRLEGLVRERLQRYLEDESELQVEAEDEVMRHLETLPRHAKRLLNRLRLLLFIAHERKMFGGVPKLTSRHVGKWAVLCERWPELALEVVEKPELMSSLEDPVFHDSVLEEIGKKYLGDTELSLFCLSNQEVRLSEVINRIVQFAPAESEA